jgi:hypothetical protein
MTDAPAHDLSDTKASSDELDPELLNLPDPPKHGRTLTVALLVFTALASLAMVLALRRDAAYAFAPSSPRDLGDLNAAMSSELANSENQYVRGQAMLGAAHAIRYERPLVSDSFRLMPVAGHDNVWVEIRVPPRGENIRWVPPSQVSGRLVRFETAGPRHRGLAGAIHDATGQQVPDGAWLVVDGAAPSDARWAVMLVALFACFAIWNAFATQKLLGRVNEQA